MGTFVSMRQFAPLACLILALALPGCGGMVPSGREAPRIERITPDPSARQCLAGLGTKGARFSALPDRYDGGGCGLRNAITMDRVSGDLSALEIARLGPVACPTAQAFSDWARYGIDRAARQLLGTQLVRIETMGSYACRNVAGTARRSAHATAEAVDVAAFVLADGRRISVLQHWNGGDKQERAFLRTVQASACKRFGTVLGPDYNAAHRDHIHVERGGSGGFCR